MRFWEICNGFIESSTYGWIKAKENYEIFGRLFHLLGISITSYSIVLGLIFITLFLLRQMALERKDKTPLVSIGLLKNREFSSGTTVLAVAVLGQFGLVFTLPVFLQGLLGKDAFHTGIAVLPLSLAILIGSPLAGIMAGKWNVPQRHLIQAGLVLALIGSILIRTEVSSTSTVATFVPGMVAFGLGFGLLISQLANLTLSAVSVQMAGEASGVNNTFRQIGTSMGQALIGALLISALATQLTHDVSASTVLPAVTKPHVAAQISAAVQSLGTADVVPKGASAPLIKEIVRIKNDAIVGGVKRGMEGVIAAEAAALLLSVTLPKRAQKHEYTESARAAES